MFSKNFKKPILLLAVILILVGFSALILWKSNFLNFSNEGDNCTAVLRESTVSAKPMESFSLEKLKEFDGIRNPKIYLGLDCLVYDVTAGKDKYYGEGKPYHYLVGRDASAQLKIFGGDIIKNKYQVVGVLKPSK